MDIRTELLAVVKALNAAELPYALCGGLAVGVHGYPRATEDTDLLIPPDHLTAAKQALAGCGLTLESGRIPLGVKTENPHELFRVSKVVDQDILTVGLLLVCGDLKGAWERRQRLRWSGGSLGDS